MERYIFAVVNDTIPRVWWKRSKMKCWLSPATVHLIWAKRLCYKRMKSNSALWSKYKHLRSEVCNMTRRDYMHYVDTIISNLYCSQKPFWNWIKLVNLLYVPSLIHNNNVITSDSAKAALFNDYFVSVFTKECTSNLEELQCHLPMKSFHLDTLI